MIDPARIAAERAYLLRYARLHLRDGQQAEEVVQDTLLAALESAESYAGKSALRTWLTGILKFKIIDEIRRQQRSPALGSGGDDDADFEALFFDDSGHWQHPVRSWGQPEASLLDKQVWDVFEQCTRIMPARPAQVFVMREVMGLELDEIGRDMAISVANVSALLYRARLRLRECMDIRWMGAGA